MVFKTISGIVNTLDIGNNGSTINIFMLIILLIFNILRIANQCFRQKMILFSVIILLSSCGGGGSDSGNSSTPPI